MDISDMVSNSISRSGSNKKGRMLKFDNVVGVLFSKYMRRKNQGTSSVMFPASQLGHSTHMKNFVALIPHCNVPHNHISKRFDTPL